MKLKRRGKELAKVNAVVIRKIKAAKSKPRGNEVKMGRRPHFLAQETVITREFTALATS